MFCNDLNIQKDELSNNPLSLNPIQASQSMTTDNGLSWLTIYTHFDFGSVNNNNNNNSNKIAFSSSNHSSPA